MRIQPVKIRRLIPPKDNLWEVLNKITPKIKENTIVAITSKIVSIGEGRCILIDHVKDKDKLIIGEAEKYLSRDLVPGKYLMHTIKHNLLIPTAGIDESNANGYYILYPKDPQKSVKKIWRYLIKLSGIKNLGVIITDSHSIPMRRGIVGISLAFYGFKPLIDYREKIDLFGRTLKVSQTNVPDCLAATAVLAMGEGAEQTPIALISDLPGKIKFSSRLAKLKGDWSDFKVPLKHDLYKPFLVSVPWKRGGGGR